MSNPKHTPGPWTINLIERGPDEGEFRQVITSKHSVVLESRDLVNVFDAKLIAAAPCLLAACEIAINNLSKVALDPELQRLGKKATIEALIEAVNKATGEK